MRILQKNSILKGTVAAKRARFGYLFILPLLIGLAVIFIPNLIETFLYSISDIDPSAGFALKPKGFIYYKDALTVDPKFTRLLVDDIIGLVTDIPVIIIYSLFIAVLLNQNFKGRGLARIIFFYPVIMATGFMNSIDTNSSMSALGQAIDNGAAADLSSLTHVSGILSSLYFPEPLIKVISDAI